MTSITRVRTEALLPPFSRTPVLSVALATSAVLLAVSPWYGYHRDELYFRLLGGHPQLGYFDTPPLTPMIARWSTAVFGDTVVALRIVPALCAGLVIVLVALITRELGGNRRAQILAAAGTATASLPLIAGHTLLTLTPDLLLWTATTLCLMRALLRGDGRYWIWVGLIAGFATYNRDLIVLLLGAIGVGILAAGPREVLKDKRLWIGALLAIAVAAPNLVYQVTHDWPQFQMAEALKIDEGTTNRITFVPLQLLLLGPPQAVVGVVGWRRLWRDPRTRALSIAYPVACAVTLYSAGRADYLVGFLLYLFAAGCVSAAEWRWRRTLVTAFAVTAVVSIVVALPVIPAASLPGTPVAVANEVSVESVGMYDLARQVGQVVHGLPEQERAGAVLLAGNYGEAGALDRWAGEFGLPKVYSGHNELWWWGPPPEGTRVVVAVDFTARGLGTVFARCTQAATVTGMAGEEQDNPIIVCHDPLQPWSQIWPKVRHYN
ncbi:glycosyltransferase family 39 protein [Sphaerisporangium viridialbum]|uniref:glycosyltransferase family 39 protein n=1 Tax=Sphaerisporangium viridialbum TaxID=46189 RepID=UPI003C7575AD